MTADVMTRFVPAVPSQALLGGKLLRRVQFVLTGMCVAGTFVQTCRAAEPSATSIIEAKCVGCHGEARISDLDLRDLREHLPEESEDPH